jgi:hypothetical protein
MRSRYTCITLMKTCANIGKCGSIKIILKFPVRVPMCCDAFARVSASLSVSRVFCACPVGGLVRQEAQPQHSGTVVRSDDNTPRTQTKNTQP